MWGTSILRKSAIFSLELLGIPPFRVGCLLFLPTNAHLPLVVLALCRNANFKQVPKFEEAPFNLAGSQQGMRNEMTPISHPLWFPVNKNFPVHSQHPDSVIPYKVAPASCKTLKLSLALGNAGGSLAKNPPFRASSNAAVSTKPAGSLLIIWFHAAGYQAWIGLCDMCTHADMGFTGKV